MRHTFGVGMTGIGAASLALAAFEYMFLREPIEAMWAAFVSQ